MASGLLRNMRERLTVRREESEGKKCVYWVNGRRGKSILSQEKKKPDTVVYRDGGREVLGDKKRGENLLPVEVEWRSCVMCARGKKERSKLPTSSMRRGGEARKRNPGRSKQKQRKIPQGVEILA